MRKNSETHTYFAFYEQNINNDSKELCKPGGARMPKNPNLGKNENFSFMSYGAECDFYFDSDVSTDLYYTLYKSIRR